MWTAGTVLVCAVMLLSRRADSFPPVQFVDTVPADVSAHAEAFVRGGDPHIYLVTSSEAFALARRATYRCGALQAQRKLASVLVHEEWHVRHGSDEAGAYEAQLAALISLGAGPGNAVYDEVSRAMHDALAQQRSGARLQHRKY